MTDSRAGLEQAARHLQQGDLVQAELLLRAILRDAPEDAEAIGRLGYVAWRRGQTAEALSLCERAARLRPTEARFHANLGIVLRDAGRLDEAIAAYRRAIACDPASAQAHNNLGIALRDHGAPEEAAAAYRAAIALAPNQMEAYYNLGNVLKDLGRMTEAAAAYRRAIEIKPDHANAHHNLGLTLLQLGDWAKGWAEAEWRWRLPAHAPRRARYTMPLWRGEDASGKRVLLWQEQGVGDAILYGTVLADLLATGADVALAIDRRLAPVFRRAFTGLEIIPLADTDRDVAPSPERFAFHGNMGLLARYFRGEAARFAGTRAYLKPDSERVAAFRARHEALGAGPKIGISWRSASPTYRRKNVAIEEWLPLLRTGGAVFVDLQYGDTREERDRMRLLGIAIHRDESFDNFADLEGLVAQIAALDSVITVSNVNAHIAGALGRPADIILRPGHPWYWGAGERTPWYVSLRLHRPAGEDAIVTLMEELARGFRI